MATSPEIIIAPAFFAMVAYVAWLVMNAWHRHEQLKRTAEFNTRLIERLGSVKDFSEFLQTQGGSSLLHSFTIEPTSTTVHDRILRASAVGVVLIALSLGLLFLGWYFTFRDREAFTVLGVIVLSLGLGGITSSGVSYRLARTLGVLNGSGRRASGYPT
jgi:TRAP-type mannitol/chloroaromatic compound transport system permease large subunit